LAWTFGKHVFVLQHLEGLRIDVMLIHDGPRRCAALSRFGEKLRCGFDGGIAHAMR
jgi:hypothetical protein